MKKFLGISFKIIFILMVLFFVVIFSVGVYSLTVKVVPLETAKINDASLNIEVFNAQGLELKENNTINTDYITIDLIPKHTKDAFISIEDKEFYKHKGINVKRIFGAFINNLKKFELKEGASTITQQLIKNTHLSNAKTLTRKLNEVNLALQLEKKFSKDEILQHYLNIIYFGNNCYGIENASKYYFSKSASALDIAESATLAGMIKSPNYYSPIKNPEKALKRRNIVLAEMEKDGKIAKVKFLQEQAKPMIVNITPHQKNKLNSYSQSAIDEASEILRMPEKQIALAGYKIYTYQDLDKQISMQNAIDKANIESDYAMINIDAKSGGVLAYYGKSNYKILDYKRQVGSVIKPLLVYGPAINENLISPATLILDEPIAINGYSPTNSNGRYNGFVSVRESISKSHNIPAVKTASYVGLEKIIKYADKMSLDLDKKDYSYSLALGGLTYGYNIKELAGAYSVFTNNGEFITPKFVNYITNSKGEVVYKNNPAKTKVFRDDTAFLITDMLKTCSKSGTAKRLADLNFDIASKTGTVGNKKGNTDAYNIAYTTEDIVCSWFGNMDNSLINVAGGNQPTSLSKSYFENIYKKHKPKDFAVPNSIEKIEIDQVELTENHILVRANELTEPKDIKSEYFSKFNLPKQKNLSFAKLEPELEGHIENDKAVLRFRAEKECEYRLFAIKNGKRIMLKTFFDRTGEVEFVENLVQNQKVEYFVEANLKNQKNNIAKSNVVKLFNNNTVTKDKWYI